MSSGPFSQPVIENTDAHQLRVEARQRRKEKKKEQKSSRIATIRAEKARVNKQRLEKRLSNSAKADNRRKGQINQARGANH